MHREGERLILLKTSWDKHSSKLPWDAAMEKVGGGRIERNEKEILKNLSSFYPLDQEMSGCIFISCSCCSFSLQCLQWSPDLEGLWLWVLWGKGWGKNCSTAACPAGLVCPLPGCSSPVQSVWKRLFLFFTFQNFWPTHSYPTLVCPFMFPCFIFIFRRIICLEIAGVPEALNHLFSPPQAFLSQKSFPFHPLLTSQKIFSGNYLPDTAIPVLPHLLCCSFSGCKRSIFKLSTTVRTDILLSGNCWTRNWKMSSNAAEKADCHYGSKSSHQGHKQ